MEKSEIVRESRDFVINNPDGWELRISPEELLAVVAHIQAGVKEQQSKNPDAIQVARQFGLRLQGKINPERYPLLCKVVSMGWGGSTDQQ
jgi:hypothetical protein